jgi:type I restriction enzyme S subunit
MLLGDFCKLNSLSLGNKTPESEMVYLDTGNLDRGEIKDLQKLQESDKFPSRARRLVSPLDILYSTVRPNQCHYGIVTKNIPNLVVSTGFCTISVNQEIADPFYVYYFLTQESIVNQLQDLAEQSTSTYPSITPSILEALDIDLPPLGCQKKIGIQLYALDRKVQLNKQINDNLASDYC